MFDLMDNHGAYGGDGRTLEQIGAALGTDSTALVSVAARTPQKSALKIFRLLYPTVDSRARCQSISRIPQEQLNDIYGKLSDIVSIEINFHLSVYVRTLHRNLSFSLTDMRRAVGTSIRSAWSELRRMHAHHQQQLQQQPNQMPNANGFDPNAVDDLIEDGTSDILDENEEKTEDENDNSSDDEQDEEDVNQLLIHNGDEDDGDEDD